MNATASIPDVMRSGLRGRLPERYDDFWEGPFRGELSRYLRLGARVLDHVRPLDKALENMRRYLEPGGGMVSRLSGGRSVSALLNRAVPHRAAIWLETTLRGRDPQSIFPAQ